MAEHGADDVTSEGLTAELLRRTHLCKPSDLPDVVVEEAEAGVGATDVVLYLVNYEHTALVPVPARRSPSRPEQPLDGTMAGRAFTSSTILVAVADDPGRRRLWLPLLDGTDRLGTLELTVAADNDQVSTQLVTVCERYAHLVAQSVLSKSLYGDVFTRVQRSRPMTVGSELLRAVLPPMTYATDGLVISAMLEPSYDNGGDAFDYAVNDATAHIAVFDAMGHGLAAARVATLGVAAYRHSRRGGLDLAGTYAAMDEAIGEQFGDGRYLTAVLAELDLGTGRLAWVNAGHPAPLLLRAGKMVKLLEVEPATPLGVPFVHDHLAVGEEDLQPGDLLLFFTDGLPEARLPDGQFFTVDRLAEFVEREAGAGQPAPETLRRLRRAILSYQNDVLQDDATALLVEWNRGSEHRLTPQTVE